MNQQPGGIVRFDFDEDYGFTREEELTRLIESQKTRICYTRNRIFPLGLLPTIVVSLERLKEQFDNDWVDSARINFVGSSEIISIDSKQEMRWALEDVKDV